MRILILIINGGFSRVLSNAFNDSAPVWARLTATIGGIGFFLIFCHVGTYLGGVLANYTRKFFQRPV